MPVSYSRTAFRSFLRLGNIRRGMICDALKAAGDTGGEAGFADRELPGGVVSRALGDGLHVVFTRNGDAMVVLAITTRGEGPAAYLMNEAGAATKAATTNSAGLNL